MSRYKADLTVSVVSFLSEWNRCDEEELTIPKGGNQNPYIEEEQTTQWSKEKVQKDKQRSTKHTHETKNLVTRNPLKAGGAPEE
jgi:hypothetical protein